MEECYYGMLAKLETKKLTIKESVENKLIESNAWFLIFIAVVLALGVTIYAGLVIWCVVYKGKTFTGVWKWKSGIAVYASCK